MRKGILLSLLFFPAAFASYNYQNGNSYNVTPQAGGGAQINGYNSNTGSTWNTTIDKGGNQRGMDSSGNSWNYNKSTGTYMNSNGKVCIGSGATRTCS